ncbi:MAG: hypothetical protein OHK0029_19510 [Armatimonadaceae bacterium]
MATRVSAVFDNYSQADQAVSALRQMGVSDSNLAILSRNDIEGYAKQQGHHEDRSGDDAGERLGKGLGIGAGVGALFGLAAAAIPGVGPFITAGWLAETLGVAGGAAVAGAVVGGTSGAISSLLVDAGYTEEEARYYGDALDQGGVFVSVDTRDDASDIERVRQTLMNYGGRMATSTPR